jgi:hypothetical protein
MAPTPDSAFAAAARGETPTFRGTNAAGEPVDLPLPKPWAEPIPTVRINDGDGGFVTINASEFDPEEHTKYAPSEEPKPKRGRPPKVQD